MQKIRCMKDLPLFACLDSNGRELVAKLAVKRVYSKGEIIFREGEPADTIYLVKYGRVKLFKTSPDGKEIILGLLKEDDLFGENTFFDSTEHVMNAQSIENTYICSCSREHLPLLLKEPAVTMQIIQFLGQKLQNQTEQMASIAFRDVKGRVSATLARLAQDYGTVTDQGILLNIELTHQDLADLVSASRVMVCNVVNDLKREGFISIYGKHFLLLDHGALAAVNHHC